MTEEATRLTTTATTTSDTWPNSRGHSNVEMKRLTRLCFLRWVNLLHLVYHLSFLDQSRSVWGCYGSCDSMIPLVQGKVNEQRPKHGSGSSERQCFDLFWPPNVDSLRWIIFHLSHQTLGMAYLWWPCGWFLRFSDIIPSSQFMKIHWFIHLESSQIISDLWTDASKFLQSLQVESLYQGTSMLCSSRPSVKEMFWAVFKGTLETNRNI